MGAGFGGRSPLLGLDLVRTMERILPMSSPVGDVFFPSGPSEVVRAIIQLIAIPVRDFVIWAGFGAAERFADKGVDSSGSVLADFDFAARFFASKCRLQDTPFNRTQASCPPDRQAIKTPHSSKVADFVFGIFPNRQPDLAFQGRL